MMPDVQFALGLLDDYLTEQGFSNFRFAPNRPDHPDLVVEWKDGARWGVEVTRTHQQVPLIGKPAPGSSDDVAAYLEKFAKELGNRTYSIRQRNYTIWHEGSSEFSSWEKRKGEFVSIKQWRKDTEREVRQHILSGANDTLRFLGGRLKPGAPGKTWRILVGAGVARLDAATTMMLRHTLDEKAVDLPRWQGGFVQRWLLLLNHAPLMDDVDEIKATLHQLVGSGRGLAGFTGIFWSGASDRALVAISLSCTSR